MATRLVYLKEEVTLYIFGRRLGLTTSHQMFHHTPPCQQLIYGRFFGIVEKIAGTTSLPQDT